jgi:hypothetical protein
MEEASTLMRITTIPFWKPEFKDVEPSEYHLWFLVEALAELRVVAVETVECVEAALDEVLDQHP